MNNFNYPKEFHTERLIFRPTNLQDAAFILELMNTEDWHKFIGDRNVLTLSDAEEYIKNKMLPQLLSLGFTNNTVIRKKDGLKIGTCGLYDREGLEGVDIGFGFLPAFYKQGYGYECASKLIELAKDLYKIENINAITSISNIASQKLLKKLGLEYKKDISLENDPEILKFYSIELKDLN